MRFIVFGLLAFTAFHNGVLADQIYRCDGDSGEPFFSHQPCGSMQGSAIYRAMAPTEAAQGLRPAEAQWLNARDKRQANDERASSRKHRGAARTSAASTARKQVYRCRRTKARLDKVRAELRRGYKAAKGERLRRKRREYEDYLDVFCS